MTPVHAAGTFEGLRCLFERDLRIALRRRSDTVAALVFFVIVVSLFPLGVGPEPTLLRSMAPGVVWVAALLASMLSLARLFADDHHDGTLEQLLLSAVPLPLLVASKIAAHWLCSGLLLALMSPLLALQFDLSPSATGVLMVSLLLGTPLLSLIGAIGAALTVGVRGASVLLSLLVLPLYIPVLIFGAGAVDASNAGLGVAGHFSLLGAMLVVASFLAPFAAAVALRISME
ncbi:MAG: heme exporter protein CcmB [Rhizobacter sp.]|nr:heme exporter protein CcmB [Rhizobacter sp.]